MANVSRRTGAEQLLSGPDSRMTKMVLKASYTGKHGDTIYLGSDGYPTNTRNSAYPIIGAQSGSILDKDDLKEKATSEDGDFVHLTDPTKVHTAEIATGARTNPFTCFTATSMFDIDGASGAQYINQALSVYDQVQVLGPHVEGTAQNGNFSEFGANQKVRFRYNQAKIVQVTSNYDQKK